MEYLDQMYFYVTGDFVEFSCKAKSPPGRIALRRRGIMSLERPAAAGFFPVRNISKTEFLLQDNGINNWLYKNFFFPPLRGASALPLQPSESKWP